LAAEYVSAWCKVALDEFGHWCTACIEPPALDVFQLSCAPEICWKRILFARRWQIPQP
jgi:hypothetical protein